MQVKVLSQKDLTTFRIKRVSDVFETATGSLVIRTCLKDGTESDVEAFADRQWSRYIIMQEEAPNQ